jgi:hypothetical protein
MRCVLGVALAFALAGYSLSEESIRPEVLRFGAYEVGPEGSAEELYFEVLRLHSVGLLSPGRLAALQDHLEGVDALYARDADYEVLLRQAILSQLRLAVAEVRHEDVQMLEAYEGRSYARRLNQAGVKTSGRYATGMLFIAGMMGIPTSKEEALLMVAVPAGGYLVVKVGGMALKRAAFLLRNCRSADDVVRSAGPRGFKVRRVADTASLGEAVAREDTELALQIEEVVARLHRTDTQGPAGLSAARITSTKNVEVRSQAPRTSEIRSVTRGAQAYASADVLRSRLRTFIAEQIKPEFDEPLEFFIHGTTHARAVEFQPERGRRLFTATDIHVARLFAQRTIGRQGGRIGAVVLAIPREIAVQLRQRGMLRTQHVPDMPEMLETIFEPGAIETLRDYSVVRPLRRPAKISCTFEMDCYLHGYGKNDRGSSANV